MDNFLRNECKYLKCYQGISYKEIAEQLQVSPKTIDYRIQQALKQLRRDLKDYLPLLPFMLQIYMNMKN